jgi:ABC-2 type transport system permease protein
MRNIWLVIKHELKTTLSKRSFWLLTFLMPAMLLAMNVYYSAQDSGLSPSSGAEDNASGETSEKTRVDEDLQIGLVDEAAVITTFPEGIPEKLFLSFPDQNTAQTALEIGDIEQYVLIPPDYVSTGEITIYTNDFRIRSGGENMGVAFGSANEWLLSYLLSTNLTGDSIISIAMQNPTPGAYAQMHALIPPAQSDQDAQALASVVGSVIPFVFYFIMIIGSGLLLQSVASEKENRTAEVLLLSINPRELMTGKLFGISLVVLIQMAIWFGGGYLVLNRGADWLNVSRFTFPPGYALWVIIFCMIGFLLYASVMSAAGAIAPTAREGTQVTYLMIIPLIPTLMFSSAFYEEPHGTISVVLSLIPFSAPSAMLTRMAVTDIPVWQIVISLVGLIVTTYLFVALAGRFFKAGNLLSTEAFNWQRFINGWRK